MKLKFKKQNISALNISHKLMGGDTHTGVIKETDLTIVTACMETYNEACTYSVEPTKCDTNDGTLKTWVRTEVSDNRTFRDC